MLCDPERRPIYRSLVQSASKPRMIEGLRPRVAAQAGELIAEARDRGVYDLHDDIAFPLAIIARLIGVPAADLERF